MQPIGVRNMKFTNTNYKGYPYRVNLQTKGICCSSLESNRQTLFTDFKKIISHLNILYHSEMNLYLISYISKQSGFNSIEKHFGIRNKFRRENIFFKNTSKEIYLNEN